MNPSELPDWLIDAWMEHGEDIAFRRGSRADRKRATGLGSKRYRRLVSLVLEHGPHPPWGLEPASNTTRRQDERKRRTATGRTHLVIGDAHATPGEDRWRFRALGRMIAAIRPDVVVDIGDWYDMPSLSSYDKGKAAIEGKRVKHDLAAGDAALRDLMLAHEAAMGAPFEGHRVRGNHGERVIRWMNDNPAAYGLLDEYDSAFVEAGWAVHEFLRPVVVDGVWYAHYFHGNSGAAFGAKHLGAQLVRERHHTCVVGHSHRLDWSVANAGGRRIHGLSVGCYTDAIKGYARQSNDVFWRGIVVLRNVIDGDFDIETYTIDRIRAEWGD